MLEANYMNISSHLSSIGTANRIIPMGADVAIKHGPPRLLLQQRECAHGILLSSPVEPLDGHCSFQRGVLTAWSPNRH